MHFRSVLWSHAEFYGLDFLCHHVGKTTLLDGVGGGDGYSGSKDKTVSRVLECYLPTEWMRHRPEERPGFPQDAQRGMEAKQEATTSDQMGDNLQWLDLVTAPHPVSSSTD